MNLRIFAALLSLNLLVLAGCADEKADLEKARYLLGSGLKADATEALSILEPMLTTSTGEEKVEVYRLYAGAKMQSVGFSGIEILPAIQYPEKTSGTINTAKMMKSAVSGVTNNSEAATALSAAIAKFVEIEADAAFSAASTRAQNGIRFQHGLAAFLDAIRIVVIQSGYRGAVSRASWMASGSSCSSNISDSDSSQVDTRLGVADTQFGLAALDAQNQIRKAASDLRTGIGGLTAAQLCLYLEQDSQF